MARRKSRKKQILARAVGAIGVPALLLLYFLGRDHWQSVLGLQSSSDHSDLSNLPDLPQGGLRIITWNLRNFGDRPGKASSAHRYDRKRTRLRRKFDDLSASILALQEIRSPTALSQLLPQYQLWISSAGGRGEQYLGFAYDSDHVQLVGEPIEHSKLSLKGRVRPAVSARFRSKLSAFDFRMIIVHLKALPKGYELRKTQWRLLIDEIRQIDRGPNRDPDLIVVGDFNSTGAKQGSSLQELAALDRSFAEVGLHRVKNETGCSAYWDGPKRDAWKEASLLDLVWTSRTLRQKLKSNAQALAHCARHRCKAFRSTKAYPDPDFAVVSDHCPIVVDLAPKTLMSLY